MKHQSKLLVEIHTVTTTRRDGTQDRHEIQSTSAGPFSTTRSKLTDLGQGRKPQRHACECQCHTLAARHSRNSSSLRSLWSPSSCRCNCRYEWQHRARYQMPTWLTGRIVQFTAYYSGAKFELAISLPEIAPYEQSLAISSKSKTVALEYLMKRRSFPTHETTLGIPLLSVCLSPLFPVQLVNFLLTLVTVCLDL